MPSSTFAPAPMVCEEEGDESDPKWMPCILYVKGFQVTAARHESPEPFGYGYVINMPLEQVNWPRLSQAKYCISGPPLLGRTDDRIASSLEISSAIRAGQDQGAQVVAVNHNVVAKIYDPLFCPDVDEYGFRQHAVCVAYSDYAHEAADFEQLQDSPEARSVMPEYHASWTMNVDTPVSQPDSSISVSYYLYIYLHGAPM